MNDREMEDDALRRDGVIVRESEIHHEALQPGFGVQEVEEDLTQLQYYIDEGSWEEALNRLKSHPDEIHHPKAQPGSKLRSMTALHLALETGECPLSLIQAILARKPLTAGMRDNHGNTPLHIACAGQFSYDQRVIGCLVSAYPQAVLISEDTEGATPLHMLLTLGGAVNITCLTLILDIAYSRMASLPLGYVPLVDMICSPLSTVLEIISNYPPIMVHFVRKMAIEDPFQFPSYFEPFLYLPLPKSLDFEPETLRPLLMMTDCKGHTPLHTCCARGLSVEVVRLLLLEYRYPGAHGASSVMDKKRRLPLFYGACYHLPIDAAKLVFDVNPEAIRHIEEYRLLHHHVAYITPVNSQEDRTLELITTRRSQTEDVRACFKTETMFHFYFLIEFYIRLAYHGTYEDPPPRCARWRALHGVVSVQSPPQVIRAAIRLYPWELHERDEDNNLPLHLACKNLYEEGNDEFYYWCLRGINREKVHHRLEPENLERENPITLLADAYPKAATYLDGDYCLPLHSAICSHKGWKDGIKSLISAAPQALATRDGKYHLYPFLLAAMDDVNTLDIVYTLLLYNPTLVQDGIRALPERRGARAAKNCFSSEPEVEHHSHKRYKSSDDEGAK